MSTRRRIRFALLGVLLLGLAACGGGGGAGPANLSPALLTGPMCLQTYGGLGGPPPYQFGQFGQLTSDGLGMITSGAVTSNVDGVLTTGPLAAPLAYSISAAHRVSLANAGTTLQGGISPAGDLLSLVDVRPGSAPTIAILARKVTGLAAAALAGTWHMCAFVSNASDDRALFGGVVTLDATLNATVSVGININGAITPAVAPVAWGTGTLGASGSFDLAVTGSVFTGGVYAGGDVIVLSGSSSATHFQGLVVLIRQSATATAATFSGTYHTAIFFGDTTAFTDYAAATSTISADGIGSWVLGPSTFNQNGIITNSAGGGGSSPYIVAPNGGLALASGTFVGGVSASGHVAVVAGRTIAGQTPQFLFLHR
ncbi:MAG: hypothetical protein O2894_05745 [Planctomycetota bacterium]|nr:hypothetical protein [Planctomycetota bacterium]